MEDNDRATDGDPRIVFNRSDCPYGCGAELPPRLRWQSTPCPRCGRTYYTTGAIVDDEGRVLWPPASIPRSPEEGQPDVRVQYVVSDEDYRESKAIVSPAMAREQRRRAQSDERMYLGCLLVVLVGIVLVVAWVASLLVNALNLA